MKTFQKRRIVPRENWLPLKVAEARKTNGQLIVTVAADSPEIFETEEAIKMARRTARRQGYLKFQRSTRTQVFGQNAMALKEYIFCK